MNTKTLKNAGLSDVQAEIYSFLLENGENKASDIAKKTKRPRGVVYKGLDDLLLLKLIEKIENKGITRFKADHPGNLEKIIEQKEKQLKEEINSKKNRLEIDKKSLSNALPDLVSMFNLSSGRPGVRIYEGKAGLVKVLNDSLSSKTEILTYAQIEGMEKYLKNDNDIYVQKRKKLGIKKRGIVADTLYAREYLKDYDQSVTDIRFINGEKYPMYLEMEIYDNKISFMTFREDKLIGVIIENEEIYKTQKSIFEMLWANAAPFENIIKTSSSDEPQEAE